MMKKDTVPKIEQIISNENKEEIEYPVLLKIGKKENLDALVSRGELHFSPAKQFKLETDDPKTLRDDTKEGCANFGMKNIMIARQVYGPLKFERLAEEGRGMITDNKIQSIPIISFMGAKGKIINAKSSYSGIEKIAKDLDKENDAVAIILNPKAFLRRLKKIASVQFGWIHYYGDKPEIPYDKLGDSDLLFYKPKKYSEQQEFRIILPKETIKEAKNYSVGSLRCMACVLPLYAFKAEYLIFVSDKKRLLGIQGSNDIKDFSFFNILGKTFEKDK